ncbi:MAG: hypothetical protein HC905_01985 [Bacteroidales bacterium]|nr:hypothetical protein [Bacteroidales bacterium]
MIAEKIGIGVNGIDTLLNSLFLNELSAANSLRFKYIAPERGNEFSKFMNNLKYTGENEELYSDLSSITLDVYKKLLTKAQSEYMVIFSQYYFKKQEKAFPIAISYH